MARPSGECAVPRPPTYTSESPGPQVAGSSSSDSESLVSAPSRPTSPHQPIRPRSAQAYHSPHAAGLASQGYIVHDYPEAGHRIRQLPAAPPPPKQSPGGNATNYACIQRKTPLHRKFPFSGSQASSSITGTFTVDPFLHIPVELLPPLPVNANARKDDTQRKNLRLEVENGGIDVDICIVSAAAPKLMPRTTLSLSLAGGSRDSTFPIVARIHALSPRPPFHLTAQATNGAVTLHLPRSYHGVVVISVKMGNLNNYIWMSAGMQENATILSETAQGRTYFVGRMGDWERVGDKVQVNVFGGKVRVLYENEVLRKRGWSVFR